MNQNVLPCQVPNIRVSGLKEPSNVALGPFPNLSSESAILLVVVTNASDQPLVAISGVWSIEKNDGTVESVTHCCDVFLGTAQTAITGPHSRILFGPNTCMSEDLLLKTQPSALLWSLEQRAAARLIDSRSVTIKIDAVMFGNGDMYAETDSYVRDIEARLSAASKFSDLVRQTPAVSHSTDDLRSAIKAIPGTSRPERMWLDMHVHSLEFRPKWVSLLQPPANPSPLKINFHKISQNS